MRSWKQLPLSGLLALALSLAPFSAWAVQSPAMKKAGPEAKPEAKAEAKPEPKAEAKAQSKPEAKAESGQSEPKADSAKDQAQDQAQDGDQAQDAKDQAQDQAKGEDKAEKAPVKHKSPGIAGGLAFFPGIVVHGAGHMYAGSWMKGLGLLAVEGIAAGVGAVTVSNGWNDIQKLMDGTKNGAVPTNVGTAYQTLGVGMVCAMAFLWTWFDDMAGAPIAAHEYNRLADEAAGQAKLQFTPSGDGAVLALVKRF
jgi:hypothetical protein